MEGGKGVGSMGVEAAVPEVRGVLRGAGKGSDA